MTDPKPDDRISWDDLVVVKNLRRVDVRPGDRFVLLCNHSITAETSDRIRKLWSEFMGRDVPILVLPRGYEVGVIRREAGGEELVHRHDFAEVLMDTARERQTRCRCGATLWEPR